MILLSNIAKFTLYSYFNISKLLHFYQNNYYNKLNITNSINNTKDFSNITSVFIDLNNKN